MEQSVFNVDNFRNAQCTESEIGAPWEDRWSLIDAMNGLCLDDQVGTTKGAPHDAGDGDPDWSKPVWERELAAYHEDPARYRATNSTNLNKLLEIEQKQVEKAEAKKAAKKAEKFNPKEATMEELRRRLWIAFGAIHEDTGELCKSNFDPKNFSSEVNANIERIERAVRETVKDIPDTYGNKDRSAIAVECAMYWVRELANMATGRPSQTFASGWKLDPNSGALLMTDND